VDTTIANNAAGRISFGGVYTVSVTGTVTRGDYLETSTTAGKAKSAGTGKTGATFAIALTSDSGGSVTALLLPSAQAATGSYVRLTKAAVQTLTTATITALTFDTETVDTDGFHDSGVNPTRITIPAGKGGMYLVSLHYSLQTGVNTSAAFKLNGTTYFGSFFNTGDFGIFQSQDGYHLSVLYYFAAGDYIEAYGYHTRGSNDDVVAVFSVAKVG